MRDGTVVDGAVDLVGVQRLGVVLLDQAVDAGELVEESRRVDSSEADWAATLLLMKEPRRAQVARKMVTEKRARRVRGPSAWITSKVGGRDGEAGLPRKNSSPT